MPQLRHTWRIAIPLAGNFAETQFSTVVEKKRPVLKQTLIVVAIPRHGNTDACDGGHWKNLVQPRVRPPYFRARTAL